VTSPPLLLLLLLLLLLMMMTVSFVPCALQGPGTLRHAPHPQVRSAVWILRILPKLHEQ
jgi:hypothetical protein